MNDAKRNNRIMEKFKSKIIKSRGCWNFAGNKTKEGYGRMWIKDRTIFAHRYSYELHNGKISDGLFVLHRCDNPPCVNPAHLYLGTQLENMRDRKTRKPDSYAKGTQIFGSKLNDKDVVEIIKMRKSGMRILYISIRFNISISTVCDIMHKRTWRHVWKKI